MRKRTTLILATAVATMMLALVPAAGADEQGELYEISGPAFDIETAPDGSLLVAQGTRILEIRKGEVGVVAEVERDNPSPVNGLAANGRGDFFATVQGGDAAVGQELLRVSRGVVRQVADIGGFEQLNDPDAFQGPQWKDQRCEDEGPFTQGPQSNPFHLELLNGGTAVIADAAGNTLLTANASGNVDWVAVFTPPVDADGEWLKRFELDTPGGAVPCYVQPVPTSVAIGPNGDYYVGTLTGSTTDVGEDIDDETDDIPGVDARGLSAVWRIDGSSKHVVCSEAEPMAGCEKAISGLTSVIDVAFGPDGHLYILEYDANGWWAAFATGPAGSRILRCDLATDHERDDCELVAGESGSMLFVGAMTFDKSGNLWVLEGNIFPTATVRQLDLP